MKRLLEEELRAARFGGSGIPDRAFVVLMDPYTGEVLTMAGKQIVKDSETGKYTMIDNALGNIQEAYIAGSVVKGATIMTGFK